MTKIQKFNLGTSIRKTVFPSGTTNEELPNPGALNIGYPPEMDDHVFHPFLHNDLGSYIERGGTIAYSGLNYTVTEANNKAMFDASGRFNAINNNTFTGTTMTITLTNLPTTFPYSAYIGIVFGHRNFAPRSIIIETSTNNGAAFTERLNDNSGKVVYTCTYDTGGTATNAIRFTLGLADLSSQIRIQSICAYNYNSEGMHNYFVPLGGGTFKGNVEVSHASSPALTVTDTTNTVQSSIFSDDNNSHIGSLSNHNVIFRQNNTEKLRLTTNGLLGTDFFMQFPPSTPISNGGGSEATYYQNGALTSLDASLANSPVPQAMTVLKMRLYVNNALSGGGARVYVLKNNTNITGTNKEIDVTTSTFAFEANAVNTNFAAGDRIGIKIIVEPGASAAWYHVVLLCRMTIA